MMMKMIKTLSFFSFFLLSIMMPPMASASVMVAKNPGDESCKLCVHLAVCFLTTTKDEKDDDDLMMHPI